MSTKLLFAMSFFLFFRRLFVKTFHFSQFILIRRFWFFFSNNDNYFNDNFVLSKRIFVLFTNNFLTMKSFTLNEMSFSQSIN